MEQTYDEIKKIVDDYINKNTNLYELYKNLQKFNKDEKDYALAKIIIEMKEQKGEKHGKLAI